MTVLNALENWITGLTTSPVFLTLAGFAVLLLILLGALSQIRPNSARDTPDPARALRKLLGAETIHPFWLTLAVALWGVLFFLLFAGLIATIWAVIREAIPAAPTPEGDRSTIWEFRFLIAKLGGLTAVLGAVVALPFTIIRLRISNEDNETKKAALYNDKIDAALADLHAQRQVTIVEDGERHTVWEDDITRRNGAIDRLEALAQENPDDAKRISRMLCTYLRELSREHPPEKPPADADPGALRAWAQGLKPVRSDMENAAQTIGRLTDIKGITAKDLDRDLQGVNLQKFRLQDLNFDHTDLRAAHLEGADLREAHLKTANLREAHMETAALWSANLAGANLWAARLEAADLRKAYLEKALLRKAYLNWADLWTAQLGGADLRKADLEGADLWEACLEEANLCWANLERANLREAYLEGAILGEAQLQEADLRHAHLEATDLRGAHLDQFTNLTAAYTRLAAVKTVDWSMTSLPQWQIDAMFGDASVILPEGIAHPAHWPDSDLDWDEFDKEWELFKSDPDAYIPPQDRD